MAIALLGCAGLEDGDGEPDVSSASVAASVESDDLTIRFAGDASGQVVVARPSSGIPVAVCQATCSVPLTAGEQFELIAVTPSTFGGWGDLCTGTNPVCSFTMAAGVAADATFTKGPAEEWTLLLPDRAVSADFDADGDLVVGTVAGLHKVSAAGAPIWFQGAVSGAARVDPDGDIFAVAGEDLIKVRGDDGTVLWTRHLGPNGCDELTVMGHLFETSPGGDVAIQQGGTLRVFDGTGAERWSASVPRVNCAVAVNSQGVIHAASADPESFEPTILTRCTADGVRLSDTPEVTPQYTVAVAFDPSDFLLASSAGHGHVDVLRWSPDLELAYWEAIDTFDPDFVDNGVAADASGHAIWAFALDDGSNPLEGVEAQWIDPDGVVELTVFKVSLRANGWTFGVHPYDVAADDGNFVLVGEFGGCFDDAIPTVGWVQAYRP